jgi:hypothetical protein
MFKNFPQILTHKNSLQFGNLVLHDKIVTKSDGAFKVKNRECPHRAYPIGNPGDILQKLECNLHGFCWNNNGLPIKPNIYKLQDCGSITEGKSGLLFQNFNEPTESSWVKILENETQLEYVRSEVGSSYGSWLWLMDIYSDLLHIRKNGVHPNLSLEIPLDTLTLEQGEDWILQKNTGSGFWLFIFPFTAIEWSTGKLSVKRIVPHNINQEFGFDWQVQLFYNKDIDSSQRKIWESLIDVYKEDITAIEKIRKPFYPLKKSISKWEDQTKLWGDWYLNNKK